MAFIRSLYSTLRPQPIADFFKVLKIDIYVHETDSVSIFVYILK